jgi:hypothetical protein
MFSWIEAAWHLRSALVGNGFMSEMKVRTCVDLVILHELVARLRIVHGNAILHILTALMFSFPGWDNFLQSFDDGSLRGNRYATCCRRTDRTFELRTTSRLKKGAAGRVG